MPLRLVTSEDDPLAQFTRPAIDLDLQPHRPGYVCELLEFKLDDDTRRRIDQASASVGVPSATLVLIALETSRVADLLAEELELPTQQIATWLDEAAATAVARGVDPHGIRRLREYARALASGASKPERTRPCLFTLHVPAALLGPWALRAADAGVELEQWTAATLAAACLDRVKWEIAASYEGQSLEAWAAVAVARALKRPRS